MSISYNPKEKKWDLQEITEDETKIIVAMGMAFWAGILSHKLGDEDLDDDYPDIEDIPNSAFHKT